MIPKNIILCWFGPKDNFKKTEQICRQSIEAVYDKNEYNYIILTEETFDVNQFEYTKLAYQHKLYGFVSDFARLYALEKYGGIYFDSDVLVLKKLSEDILKEKLVLGSVISKNFINTTSELVSAGMIAAEPHHHFIQKLLYKFFDKNISDESITSMVLMDNISKLVVKYGFSKEVLDQNAIIRSNDVTIFPFDYFTCCYWSKQAIDICDVTENSYCIHLFNTSWRQTKIYKSRASKRIEKLFNTMETKL